MIPKILRKNDIISYKTEMKPRGLLREDEEDSRMIVLVVTMIPKILRKKDIISYKTERIV
jgi:hypothetical protein